jgi:hypothetical protein
MNWVTDLLAWKVVPSHRDKYVYAFAGAVVGGVAFGLTGSWAIAITWDLIAAFTCWAIVKLAAPLGGFLITGKWDWD